jgi:hypothetical protein
MAVHASGTEKGGELSISGKVILENEGKTHQHRLTFPNAS